MPDRKRKPLIGSVTALRILATGITALSLGGMSIYASGHLYNTTAPLQPTAAQTAATPAPAAATTTRTTTGRIQLSVGVPTTTAKPVTKTHRS
jgi:hypothetical protein